MIRSRNIDPLSPQRYQIMEFSGALPALTGTLAGVMFGIWGFKQLNMANAKIVDVIVGQSTAGTAGTSWSVAIKKNTTAICSTAPVLALASGANAAMDCKGDLALPTGATRGMLKTDGSILIKKGDVIQYDLTVTGTYTGAAPQVYVGIIIDPYPL